MVNHSQKNRAQRHNIAVLVIIRMLKGYRYLISPWIGNQCRFYPSCSCYAEQAFGRFGFFKGIYLTLRRLLKCHPWHRGGEDPVPDTPCQLSRRLSRQQRPHPYRQND